jgi:hypothetical protein
MEQKLEKSLNEFIQAETNADADVLDGLLANDFVGIGPLGFLLTKEQWLARYRNGDLQNTKFEITDLQTRIYGKLSIKAGSQKSGRDKDLK